MRVRKIETYLDPRVSHLSLLCLPSQRQAVFRIALVP